MISPTWSFVQAMEVLTLIKFVSYTETLSPVLEEAEQELLAQVIRHVESNPEDVERYQDQIRFRRELSDDGT